MTLIEMLERNMKLFPEKTALIYKETRISYKTLYEETNALANFLISLGLKKGERVGLLLNKTPEAITSFLGVALAGGVVFPIDNHQTLNHIQFILDLAHPSILIVSDDFQSLLSSLRLPCSNKEIIMIGKKSVKQYNTWEKIITKNRFGPSPVKVLAEDMVYLNFTSGTTGVPKAAITTHNNLYWNTISSVESFDLTHDDIHLCMFPVFGHPHELFSRPLYLGGTFVLIDNISPKSIARAISEHKVTCTMATASIYATLARFHDFSSFDFSSLRIPESGGMHVNPTLVQEFEDRFKVPIFPVWGSTETTGIALCCGTNYEYKPGTMGQACPYYEIKIIDNNGKELPPNKIGEMIIKGPGVCSGYFENSNETKKYMKNGWFFTGDLAKKDSEGFYYFASRKTGMMKVAGLKVYPTEIEDVLISHPNVSEVAVIGANDGLRGEVPKAVIVIKEGLELSKRDIYTYCEHRMSKYKIPRFIEFRNKLPKTAGGKILTREL